MNQRRRLANGFYPDRGMSDPVIVDIDTEIASGGAYLDLPVPENCVLVVTSSSWSLADITAGGDFVFARTFATACRRDGDAAPGAVTSPHALTSSGVMVATPTETTVANAGPTGALLRFACAFTVATRCRLRARLVVQALPLP